MKFFFSGKLLSGSIIVFAMLLLSSPVSARKQGQELIDSLVLVIGKMKPDTTKAYLLASIGNEYSSIDPDKGLSYTNQALALSTTIGWDKGIATAYNILGICCYYKSENPAALRYWDKGMVIFRRTGDKNGILKIIGNISSIYTVEGNYAKAIELCFEALKYAEELNDTNSIAINLGNIGANYGYIKNNIKALEYYKKAVAMFMSLGDKQSAAIFLGNIGNTYSNMTLPGDAIRYTDSALKLNEMSGDNEGITRSLNNLGNMYNDLGNYDKAINYVFKALARARKYGFKAQEVSAISHIGETLLQFASDSTPQKKCLSFPGHHTPWCLPADKAAVLDTAIYFLKQGLAMSTDISDLNQLQANYHFLSEAEALTGNYKEAFENHKQYMRIKDSVFSSDNKIKIANLETQRELELKDKQIIIDRLEVAKKRNERALFGAALLLLLIIAVFVVRNIRLSTAKELSENKLNAFQARMNPHFIFNSLSSIQSLILNNETESSIDYLSEFSILMRQILDNSGQSKVTLKTEIDMLRSYIALEHLRFDGFSRNITVAGNINEEALHVPGMVVQPFVENAILHGLVSRGDAGRLDVSFERDEKHVICTVEDNGVGRVRSGEINRKRSRSRQSHGTAIATNRLTLLNDKKKGLVNKVEYTDKMENGIAAGTKVTIYLPIL